MTFARGRHEHVYRSSNRGHWHRAGDIDTQGEILNVYRKLDKSGAQILLVKVDLLTGSVRHSHPSMHSLSGQSNDQLIESRAPRRRRPGHRGSRSQRFGLRASGFDARIEGPVSARRVGEPCVMRRRRYRLNEVCDASIKERFGYETEQRRRSPVRRYEGADLLRLGPLSE